VSEKERPHIVLCGRSFCISYIGQTLVNGGFGAPDADDGGGDLFPAVAAAHAVHPQAGALLVAAQSLLGAGTKNAVDTAAGLVAKGGKRILQNHDIAAPAAPAQGGVACGGAAARRCAVAAVKVHPCGGLAQRLHIAPCAGSAGSVVNGGALALVKALPHIERHPGVVLAAGAVATLPDAAESVPYRDASAVFAAGQVPRFHGGNGGP